MRFFIYTLIIKYGTSAQTTYGFKLPLYLNINPICVLIFLYMCFFMCCLTKFIDT